MTASPSDPRGLWLVPAAILVWIAAIVGNAVGASAALIAVLPGLVALMVPERRLRAHGALCVIAGLALGAVLSGLHADRAAVDAAAVGPARITADVRLTSSPASPAHRAGAAPWRTAHLSASAVPLGTDATIGRHTVSLPAGSRFVLRIDESTRGIGPEDATALAAGDAVRVSGRFERDGSTFFVTVTDLSRSTAPTPGAGEGPAWRATIHARLREATAFLPPDEAALVRGMTIGDTSGMSAEVDEAMKVSGLTHLVAVSGANVAFVYASVAIPLLYLGVRRRVRVALAGLAILGYVLVVGPEPSLVRAATMAAPLLVARFIGVRTPALNALALAVLAWSIIEPPLAASYGFVLSVLATGAILVLAPWLARLLHEASGKRVSERLALVLAVPFAAQVACTPVLILLRPELSIWSVSANILAEIVVAPATILGFVGAILVPIAPLPATWALWASGALAHVLVLIALVFESLPGAHVTLPAGARGVVLAALAIAAGIALLRLRSNRIVRWALAASLALVLAAWGVRAGSGAGEDWQVAMCDVGQGDALVVREQASAEAPTILVDTGPDPRVLETCLGALGVQRIDLAILTHPHADHVGALEVLSGPLAPREAWLCPLDDSTARSLPPSTSVTMPLAGHAEHLGGLGLTVLWPPSAEVARSMGAAEQGSDESALNDCSLAVHIDGPDGLSVLTLGDLEPLAQEALAASDVPEADLVKVAHHGSRRQFPELYALTRARVGLIGVGANSYGHPHPTALRMLENQGVRVLRTDEHGTVRLKIDGGQWRLLGGPALE
ncbi:MAG: ComEC/Rec2 family competence protein [Dermabacter sp.]|nr:ComEC/Rec2 family competence protein [Dermabacter sp.]